MNGRLELIREGLFVQLAKHYTSRGAQMKTILEVSSIHNTYKSIDIESSRTSSAILTFWKK